jgi:type VI secretion system Hcp family effector
MARFAFMQVDGIEGESDDASHKKWIEINSFSQGGAQPSAGQRSTGGGASSAQATLNDIVITKDFDKSSPKLFDAMVRAKHITTVKFEFVRSADDPVVYLKVNLDDVMISSIQVSQGGDQMPQESISFNPGVIEFVYTATDHKTGKAQGDVKAKFNLITNRPG